MEAATNGSMSATRRLAEDVLRAIIGGMVAAPAIWAARFWTEANGSESESPWSWSFELLVLSALLLLLLVCVAFARGGGERRASATVLAGFVGLLAVAGWLGVLFLALGHPK